VSKPQSEGKGKISNGLNRHEESAMRLWIDEYQIVTQESYRYTDGSILADEKLNLSRTDRETWGGDCGASSTRWFNICP